MSQLDKATFIAIVEGITARFEDEQFKSDLNAAAASGDIAAIGQLTMTVQSDVFTAHGLDPIDGTTAFKQAGMQYAADDDIAPPLARMKSALK